MREVAGADGADGADGVHGDILIRRGAWTGADGLPVPALFITAAGAPVDPATMARLRHGWDVRAALDPRWAAVPLDFKGGPHAAELVLADPGGALLSALLQDLIKPFDRTRFLHAALALSESVGAMHAAGIVHRDLKPVHFLLDEARGRAWIAGFTIAMVDANPDATPDATPDANPEAEPDAIPGATPAPPADIAGTWAYMAPEQTGRMMRPIDARSDLYALGVVIYEMLAGALPFDAVDPAGWIHNHLARVPTPPEEVRGQAAGMLSAIVLTLLAKNPDDRYQDALALVADLRRCLDGEAVFPLTLHGGTARRTRQLVLPRQLYGRDAALDKLTLAFERVRAKPLTELVLVAGYSGSGKSALVAEFARQDLAPHLFAAGKCDQYQHAIPFSTLAQVCESLVAHLLALPADAIAHWRDQLWLAVGDHAAQLVHVAPGLASLLDTVPAAPGASRGLPPDFNLLFRRFFQVFARTDAPLVLFLDDLQWVDAATLRLLETLVAGNEVRHLLLIVAYRDNEVDANHPLLPALALFRGAGTRTQTLLMAPLAPGELARLVADTLAAGAGDALRLAHVLEAKTGGNPFFVILFLNALIDAGLLGGGSFDARQWDWERIGAQDDTDNVVALTAARFGRLSPASQRALGRFACLGHAATRRALAVVLGVLDMPAALDAALAEAGMAGLVQPTADGYRFLHDRVQEAAYQAVADGDTAQRHLDIGRLLYAAYGPEERIDHAFELASQFNRCLALVRASREGEERRLVARLFLQAGMRARGATAHAAALGYFDAGCSLVDAALWRDDFRLAFDLQLRRAEAQFLTGELAAAEVSLASLAPRAHAIVDRAALAWMQITLYTAAGQLARAIDTGLAYLHTVGVDWSAQPTRAQAWAEYAPLAERIRAGQVGAIAALPALADAAREATLDVLVAMLPPAFFTDENLVCLVLCRIANLSIAHGNADASALGYAYLGMMLGPYFGEYHAGYRVGEIGYQLVEAGRGERFKARVTMCFAYHVMPWTRHIRAGLPLLRRAFDQAREAGDLTYTGFASCTLVTSLLAAGEHLRDVQQEAESRLALMKRARFPLVATIIATQLQLVRALRGLTLAIDNFDDAHFCEDQVELALAADPSLAIARCWYWIRKMQAHYFAGDMAAAVRALEAAAPLLWSTDGHFESAEFHFYAALVRARTSGPAGGQHTFHAKSQRDAFSHHAGMVTDWAATGPDNFACRARLLAAETARLDGRRFDALRLYEAAMAEARRQQFGYVEALAGELAGELCLAEGLATLAMPYLKQARLAYRAWGAEGKVRQLDALHPGLVDAPPAPRANETIGARRDAMDLASVLKTSDAISGEVGIERLVGTLMAIVLEHSGAERAVLVLPRENALWVEGEADMRRHGVQPARPHVPLAGFPAPAGMIEQVVQGGAAVLVDDAARVNPFGADPYFARTACRSVFCLPLRKERRVTGVLYLENSLAPHVFTAARQDILGVLATQAAAALENAALAESGALLKEVHHRVKNNLQLISSLLNRQAGHIADPAVAALFHESRNRVRAMALVHENLYRAGNFARVPMADHVRNLCRQIARAYGLNTGQVALSVDVDDIQLDLDRAVSCGLLINELITNAIKHAFPEGRTGTIHVSLHRQPGNLCLLTVRDDGAGGNGTTLPAAGGSLGQQLIQDLTDQLDGSTTLRMDGGTQVAIVFPLEPAGDAHP